MEIKLESQSIKAQINLGLCGSQDFTQARGAVCVIVGLLALTEFLPVVTERVKPSLPLHCRLRCAKTFTQDHGEIPLLEIAERVRGKSKTKHLSQHHHGSIPPAWR